MTETVAVDRPTNLGRVTNPALIVVAAIPVLTVVALSIIHMDDMFSVHLTEGLRVALAKYFNTGQLFPPVSEDGFYGGTRYMPLPIVMHGSLSLVFGDYILAGKILGLVTGVLTLGAIFFILKRRGLPLPLAFLLAAVLPATNVGLKSITGFGAELLPVLLQIVAIALVDEESSHRNVVVAALLSVIAVFTKVTALWGLGAIAIWLLLKDRRRLGLFIGVAGGSLIVGWLVIFAVSSGRVTDSFLNLVFSGPNLPLYSSFDRIIVGFRDYAPALLVLAVPLIIGLVQSRRSWNSIYLIALCIYLVILVVMFLDAATAENHLVDLVVLMSLVVGTSMAWVERSALRDWLLRLVAVAAVWAVLLGSFFTFRDPVSEAIAVARGQRDFSQYSTMPLKGLVTELDFILSSNPYIPVSRGHRPIVLEPLLFLRLSEGDPELANELSERVSNHEFSKVVLARELSEIKWYATFDFGLEVHSALVENYKLAAAAEGYFVYVPRETRPSSREIPWLQPLRGA